jgi:hypothetical protein
MVAPAKPAPRAVSATERLKLHEAMEQVLWRRPGARS